MRTSDIISIGTLAARAGVAVSAVRFYEERGLIEPLRSAGGQRRFLRADIRRVSFILIAQQLGLSLAEIRDELAQLPQGRTPSASDWRTISERLRGRLDDRIAAITRVRDTLDSCIGCGCLSLDRCALYNRTDHAAASGAGPRYLMGDQPQRSNNAADDESAGPGSDMPGPRC